MEDVFSLTAPPDFVSEAFSDEEDDLHFIVTKEPTGWTERDTLILEAALDLAGLSDGAERLKASMAVDLLDIVNLAPLVSAAQGLQVQIKMYFNKIKGGIGR